MAYPDYENVSIHSLLSLRAATNWMLKSSSYFSPNPSDHSQQPYSGFGYSQQQLSMSSYPQSSYPSSGHPRSQLTSSSYSQGSPPAYFQGLPPAYPPSNATYRATSGTSHAPSSYPMRQSISSSSSASYRSGNSGYEHSFSSNATSPTAGDYPGYSEIEDQHSPPPSSKSKGRK